LRLSYSDLSVENLGPSAILDLTGSEFNNSATSVSNSVHQHIDFRHNRAKRRSVINDLRNLSARFWARYLRVGWTELHQISKYKA